MLGTNALGRARERTAARSLPATGVPSRSVAIVPVARVYNGKPFVHLEGRLQMALSLYQAGRVKSILVSGNETAETPEVTRDDRLAAGAWRREERTS